MQRSRIISEVVRYFTHSHSSIKNRLSCGGVVFRAENASKTPKNYQNLMNAVVSIVTEYRQLTPTELTYEDFRSVIFLHYTIHKLSTMTNNDLVVSFEKIKATKSKSYQFSSTVK